MRKSPVISPADLVAALQSSRPPLLVDTRPGDELYRAGHLAGAFHADLNRDLSGATERSFDPARGGRHPLPPFERFAALAGSWGIQPQTEVVVYDGGDGSNAAARLWWMLRSSGHEHVRLLEGGYAAALLAGVASDDEAPHASGATLPTKGWSWPLFDIEDIDRLRSDPQWKVLDVRSAPRFQGESEPIDPVAGHIPGAVNLFFGENLEEGRWKSAAALRQQYGALLDGVPPERLIVHCGSGVTACHTLLALDAAGLHGAGLYVGSWSEWCRNERERFTAE